MTRKTKIYPGLNKPQQLLALLATLLLMSTWTHAQDRGLSGTGEMLDGIAAIVNDGVVLKSELDDQTSLISQRLREEGTPLPPTEILQKQVLERLVVMRIQLQRAERLGIQVTDETLNLALADIARRNNVTLSQLPELLSQNGVLYSAYRDEMRQQLIIDQLRQRDVITRILVTPRELEDYLARQEGKEFTNTDYLLSHILISIGISATPDELTDGQAQAWDIYERSQGGEEFAQLAVAYSDGQSALEGGVLGWRKGDQLPSLFAEVIPGMTAGQVSEPIRSASGFHLVRVDEMRGSEPIMENQVLARHILITTDELVDDDAAKQKLNEILEQIEDGDEFGPIAEAVSADPASAAEGGELGWTGPDAFVPAFEAVMNSLEIGEISEPFQTPYGWHILEVLDRRVHATTDDVARQKALMAIRTGKLEEETELWVRRIRDESFVEYRM
ncbi:MAG: peptidylprolyl isomerase [Gammaproteobacteria bacterium]